MYFDARAAKALKPGEHLLVSDCPGLWLKAYKTTKAWSYHYRSPVDKAQRQVKIGLWPHVGLADAIEKWKELRARRDQGEDPTLEKKQTRIAPTTSLALSEGRAYTLGQMVEDYAEGYLQRRRAAAGAKAVAQRLRSAVSEYKALHVVRITRKWAFDLIEAHADTPVAAKSIRAELAAAWDFALSAGRAPEEVPNWFKLINVKHLRSKGAVREGEYKGTGKRVLSESEIQQLFRHDLQIFSQQVQDFLTIQMFTCVRGSEVCYMRHEHIREDRDGLWWTVPKDLTKNRYRSAAGDHRVPLIGRVEVVVRRLMGERGGWLFPSTTRGGEETHTKQAYMNSKVHYYQPYSNCREDHKRARLTVTHWSAHDLRRTGRTMLASMGCPDEVAEAILGHVKPGVVGVYNLYKYDKEKRHWLALLSQRLEAIIGA
jgi:integrase